MWRQKVVEREKGETKKEDGTEKGKRKMWGIRMRCSRRGGIRIGWTQKVVRQKCGDRRRLRQQEGESERGGDKKGRRQKGGRQKRMETQRGGDRKGVETERSRDRKG